MLGTPTSQLINMKYLCGIWLGICFSVLPVQGQPVVQDSTVLPTLELKLGTVLSPLPMVESNPVFSPTSIQQIQPHFLPGYARENPAGHAPLCRLEYRIEQRWPIGIWAEADPARQVDLGLIPQPQVQFKLLRF